MQMQLISSGKFYSHCNISKINIRMTYKEKVKKELRTTLETFHNQNELGKTHNIHKKPLKKKTFRHSTNFYQRILHKIEQKDSYVLNFYNIIIINERSIIDPSYDEAFMKNLFYFKNLKKIETTENYLIAFLGDNPTISSNVSQAIEKYKTSGNKRLLKLANTLQDLEKRLKINKPQSSKQDSINDDAMDILQKLGNSPFICRISSNKIAISKSMLEMFGYDYEEFVIECLKFKIPLYEGFSCQMYYEVVMKNLQNYGLLMDLLNGRIPLSSFLQSSRMEYIDKIYSKNNVEYTCKMLVAMASPLVTIVKVEEVLEAKQTIGHENNVFLNRDLKKYCTEIRDEEYTTLQHLVRLPDCKLPQNKQKVADYIDRSSSDDEFDKSYHTLESK